MFAVFKRDGIRVIKHELGFIKGYTMFETVSFRLFGVPFEFLGDIIHIYTYIVNREDCVC